jgi:hypothetical protein
MDYPQIIFLQLRSENLSLKTRHSMSYIPTIRVDCVSGKVKRFMYQNSYILALRTFDQRTLHHI